MFYFYILRCSDNSLYCGQTKDLQKRVNEHNFDKHKSAKYLRAKKPVKLIYFEEYPTLQLALKREWQVKKWKKIKKEALVKKIKYHSHMKIHFREYKKKDRSLLLDLTTKLQTYVKSIDELHRIKNLSGYSDAFLEETLSNVKKYQGKIWFVEVDKKVVGYIIGVIWEQSEINRLEIGHHLLGEVIDLFVDEKYRGRGIGKTMLQKMENYFIDKGCDSMWIRVFSANEKAHKLYKKTGFIDREVGMLKNINYEKK